MFVGRYGCFELFHVIPPNRLRKNPAIATLLPRKFLLQKIAPYRLAWLAAVTCITQRMPGPLRR
jgi:hypothetical protein